MKMVFSLSSTLSFPFSSLQTKLRPFPKILHLPDYTKMDNSHHRRRDFSSPAGQPPATMEEPYSNSMASKHSRRASKKRKVVYEEETLTLKRGSVQCASSSNRFRSTQYSYQKHTRQHNRDSETTSRKWAYSHLDCSGFRDKLVLVSYNILGVENASRHPDLYFNIPWKYMDWNYRRACIRKEITKYDPSILCFQEVDRFTDLHDALQQDGFKGVLKARTGDACDGCAIFWKDER